MEEKAPGESTQSNKVVPADEVDSMEDTQAKIGGPARKASVAAPGANKVKLAAKRRQSAFHDDFKTKQIAKSISLTLSEGKAEIQGKSGSEMTEEEKKTEKEAKMLIFRLLGR